MRMRRMVKNAPFGPCLRRCLLQLAQYRPALAGWQAFCFANWHAAADNEGAGGAEKVEKPGPAANPTAAPSRRIRERHEHTQQPGTCADGRSDRECCQSGRSVAARL